MRQFENRDKKVKTQTNNSLVAGVKGFNNHLFCKKSGKLLMSIIPPKTPTIPYKQNPSPVYPFTRYSYVLVVLDAPVLFFFCVHTIYHILKYKFANSS